MGMNIFSKNQFFAFPNGQGAFDGLCADAPGYPISLMGFCFPSAAILFDCCRFPDHPDLQRRFVDHPDERLALRLDHFADQRGDWQAVQVAVMEWALHLKLAQNRDSFGRLLDATGDELLVHVTETDKFWGAIAVQGHIYVGANTLGKLNMALRDRNRRWNGVAEVHPPAGLRLFGEPVLSERYALV